MCFVVLTNYSSLFHFIQTQTQNMYWHVGKVDCQWPCTNI